MSHLSLVDGSTIPPIFKFLGSSGLHPNEAKLIALTAVRLFAY